MSEPRPGGPVVVGVDTSGSARTAAMWAADVAAGWDVPLHLRYVVHGWPDGAMSPDVPTWLRELADAAERIGVRTVEAVSMRGGIVDTLVEAGTGARLLVLGSYGEAAWTGLLAGSVAVGVIDRTDCPVAVVRGADPRLAPPRSGPIVVGVDGSPAGASALHLAADLAAALGAPVLALHATADAEVQAAHAQLAALRMDRPGLRITGRPVDGTALHVLGARAATVRALVVGRHRATSDPGDVPVGTVVRQLVETAPCPVLVAGRPRPGLPLPTTAAGHATR